MPLKSSQDFNAALQSAGAERVRTMQLSSGISRSEWHGQNTLTNYQGPAENVLSVYGRRRRALQPAGQP